MREEYEALFGSGYNFALKIGCHVYSTCTRILQHRNKRLLNVLCRHVIEHNQDFFGGGKGTKNSLINLHSRMWYKSKKNF
jgi:hypothetical protein